MTEIDPDDYYPTRWRLADGVEDLFLLHRAKFLGGLVVLALGVLVLGLLLLDGGDSVTETTSTTENPSTTTTFGQEEPTTAPDTSEDEDDTSTTSSTTSSSTSSSTTSTTTTSTTSTTTTTTTAAPQSDRAPDSADQLAATEPGAVIVMTPAEISVVGGLPTDAIADDTLALAAAMFPDLPVIDRQIVDDSFDEPDTVTLRLAATDLFGYNSDNLNGTYFPLIDQIAAAAIQAETWTIEVSGHTDDTGPADGNQRLSERRAASAAARLRNQGVPSSQVTSVGLGETQPIATNSTEAGRLANRRVEFEISQ